MEFRQLRYFQSVATSGSYTAASRNLNIAQPALSRHVQALEDELGVQLFLRGARGVKLTAAGEKLLEMTNFLLRYVNNIRGDLSGVGLEPSGNVTIGLPPSVVHLIAAPLIERTREEFPRLSIRIIESVSISLLKGLTSGMIDVAVLTDPGGVPGIVRLDLTEEDMVLIGGPSHFPKSSRRATIENLLGDSMVVTPGFRGVIEPWLNAHNIRPHYVMDIDSLSVIAMMVGRGLVSTVVPYGMVASEIRKGIFKALTFQDPPLRRRLVLAWSARRPVSIGAQAIQKIIQEEMAKVPVLLAKQKKRKR
jgi:LysR family nitrogen assimilation transcriptional regulator